MAVKAARHDIGRCRISDFDFRSLSERELARLWRDQTFPPEALVTGEGEKLRVIYRGRLGGGPGPDFRDALIAAPGGLLQGDIELHVRSSDFQRHGHQRDPAYARVVLHLVFWDDERRPTALPGGGTAPVAALAGWVEGRANEIARWLERPALWREPCFSALARHGAAEVAAALDRLGDMRFRRKTAALVPMIAREGKEEALWQSLLEALAFGPDREAFRLLAQQVRWASLGGRLRSLPSSGRAAEALRSLEAGLIQLPALDRAARRPANGAARRVEGAARLAARFAGKGLVESFIGIFDESSTRGDPNETKTGSANTGIGSNYGSAPRRVSNFEFRSSRGPDLERRAIASLISALTVPGLVGRGRAVEIIANAVLPWLAALGPEQRVRRAEAIFASLPVSDRYGAVRHLHEAVGTGVPKSFRRQQGMLYLLDQYCTHGGCGRCPLS